MTTRPGKPGKGDPARDKAGTPPQRPPSEPLPPPHVPTGPQAERPQVERTGPNEEGGGPSC